MEYISYSSYNNFEVLFTNFINKKLYIVSISNIKLKLIKL